MKAGGLGFWMVLLLLGILSGACQRSQGGLIVAGSTSVQPFAEALAEEYMAHAGGQKVYVQGGGSSAGIQAVRTEAAQIGMSSRWLSPGEKDLRHVPIAYDAIAVIVHPQNPVANLTPEQIRDIFSGRMTNWREVSERSTPIILVSREEGSGTREAFQHLVMGNREVSLRALVQDSNGAIRQVVGDDPNAIGYISLGLVNERVKALRVGGLEAVPENIRQRRYRLVRPFLFVFQGELQGEARRFLEFVLSPAGQDLLVREGLISRSALADPERKGP